MGAAPERYVAFFLALIHSYSALRWVIKSKKSESLIVKLIMLNFMLRKD